MENLLETLNIEDHLDQWVGDYGYWIVFLMTFLETSAFVGLVVPGEVTLLIAGWFAYRGILEMPWLLAAAWLGSILGDSAGYAIGRFGGVKFLRRFGRFFFFRERYLETSYKYFRNHGGKTVIFGRFIGVLRAFGPMVAGISRMPYGRFLVYDIAGAILSSTLILSLGYFFGESYEVINQWLGWGGVVIFVLVVAAVVAVKVIRKRRRRKVGG